MKILIISQHIFPIQTPRANRATELVKELARQGHDVTVYAVLGKYDYSQFEQKYKVQVKKIPIRFQCHPYTSDGTDTRVFIDKVLGKLFGKLLEFPNIEFKYRIVKIIKQEKKFDLLISIADPHHIHWGCSKAKEKLPLNFPTVWIADCGDPFMANVDNKFHLKYYAKYERQFCELCDYITVPVKEAIKAYFPEFQDKIKVIPQGFLFRYPLTETNNYIKNKVPTFAYAGIFYKDIRHPGIFLDFLCTLNFEFKFVIYTKYKELVLPYQSKLKEKLILKDPISRDKLLLELEKMDFLVNIENENSPSQIPSKLIDYAIANRPILSINNLNFKAEIVHDFLKGDYNERFIVHDLQQYQIANVVNEFLMLANNQNHHG